MTKILCNGCGKLIKERSKAYHDCVSTLSETTLCSALRGDSIHRTAVIDFVLALGLNQTCSHTIIAAYVCMEHQAAYCDYSGILQPAQQRLSVHKRSQVFEARFNDDEAFRARYIASVLTAKHGAICTDLSTDDYRHKLALKCIPSAPLVSTADEARFLKDFVKAFQDLLDLSTQMQLD